ncbi:unnamed protein product [Hymenolepis diminuta]|uniref:Uncharacterized protein n=1 Tax=Hymenolepis diminuta TaxID=6216 RepID=A0A0R3SM26_HYMDI|nr:unnamed protein product [Hymenolepis diminuta]
MLQFEQIGGAKFRRRRVDISVIIRSSKGGWMGGVGYPNGWLNGCSLSPPIRLPFPLNFAFERVCSFAAHPALLE